ncbi:hypothetical protein AX660_13520 [Paraglaciecola hydrolytica]|uniref:Uncharacterized protein n=1 Tax=Paraglaciecola hydrolytica TaxID=1799789 RepID=A0A136A1R1_9ALTE|nr:hypothetical protein AX660_13520 [Paraglaciecola hydrolytica]
MSNQTKPCLNLPLSADCHESCSPHWPKTLVSTSSINTQPPKPNNNARQNQKLKCLSNLGF